MELEGAWANICFRLPGCMFSYLPFQAWPCFGDKHAIKHVREWTVTWGGAGEGIASDWFRFGF